MKYPNVELIIQQAKEGSRMYMLTEKIAYALHVKDNKRAASENWRAAQRYLSEDIERFFGKMLEFPDDTDQKVFPTLIECSCMELMQAWNQICIKNSYAHKDRLYFYARGVVNEYSQLNTAT